MPRTTGDATSSFAPLPATLPGEDSVYLNFAWANQGENTAQDFFTRVYLDDGWAYTAYTSSLAPGDFDYRINRGPYFVRGGRHTLWDSVDASGVVHETSETNNVASFQYVWSPLVLSSTARVRSAPPPRYLPGNVYMNCDGYSYGVPFSRGWGAVAILPHQSSDDYDLLLYDDYQNSTNGFDTYQEWSGRGAGFVEMVLVNRRAGAPYTNYFGAIRYSAGAQGSFTVQAQNSFVKITPSVEVAGDRDTLAVPYLGSGNILVLYGLHIVQPGAYRVYLQRVSGTAGAGVSVYHKDSVHVRLNEALGLAELAPGEMQDSFDLTVADTGLYALAIWKRYASDLSQVAQIRISVALLPTNLTTWTPPGWDAPLVPRDAPDATVGNVRISDSLPGNDSATYLNYNVLNQGPNPAGAHYGRLFLDGEVLAPYFIPVPLRAGHTAYGYNWGPYYVRGGRHTLAHEVDYLDEVPETNEADNFYQRQYVWSPLTLAADAPVVRWEPPEAGTGAQPNSDGYRFARPSGYAQAMAILPRDSTDDYDLRVYTDYHGATSGFSVLVGWSATAAGLTDFVVANYQTAEDTVYPAVVRYSSAAGDSFVVEADHSAGHLISVFPTITPPETLDAREILEVFEVYLRKDSSYLFTLETGSTGTDMPGLFLFNVSNTAYYLGRAGALASGLEGTLVITAPANGWYPLVVTKHHSRQLDTEYRFRLRAEKVPGGAWTGVTSSEWNNPDNWAHRTLPTAGTAAWIPTWAVHMPEITDSARVFALRVDSLARLQLSGGHLQIAGDSLALYGRFTASGPCTLALAHGARVAVFGGGHLELNGGPSVPVVLTALAPGAYFGLEVWAAGTLSAEYTVFEHLQAAGVNLRPGSYLAPGMAFRRCVFRNGQAAPGSRLLTLNNGQDLTLEGVRFPDTGATTVYNAYKSLDAGTVTFVNATGLFAGSAHEYDPHNRIHWTVSFVPGDVNGDGTVNDADLAYLARYLYQGGPAPVPLLAGDADHDCAVTRQDLEALAAYLYTGGPPPSPCGTLNPAQAKPPHLR